MNREIKYKGQRVDNKEWVYGYYYSKILNHAGNIKKEHHFIFDLLGREYKIILETVGQFTGLKDKNDREIYTGDIVKISNHPFDDALHINGIYLVRYNDDMELCVGDWLLFRTRPYCEVIGNIYDNPELLEVEK